MKTRCLAMSNIAWPSSALDEALALLPDLGVMGIEIAPYNVFGRWDVEATDVQQLRQKIEHHGLQCVALQGILYNAPGAHLFASDDTRAMLKAHLTKVAVMAGLLGAGACVFGAPRLRDPGSIAPEKAWQTACNFLRDIGPVFAAYGSALAFEANAQHYGCKFVTRTTEAAQLVRDVSTPGVGLQIDTGTIFLEGEHADILSDVASVAVHAHVSEPDLRPLGQPESAALPHGALAAVLESSSYRGPLSVEMRPADDWRAGLRQAVEFIGGTYS